MRQSDLSKLKKATYVLKNMAHPLRLALLCALHQHGELCVNDLVELQKGKASQSHISQYLGAMRRQGLVAIRRNKQTIYYRLVSGDVKALLKTLYGLYCKE